MRAANELRQVFGKQQLEVVRVNRDPNGPASRPGDEVIDPVQAAKRARAEPCVRLEPDER